MDAGVRARARRGGGAAALVLLIAGTATAVAADRSGLEAGSARVEPNVRWGAMPDLALKIRTGFAVAVPRATNVGACAALFRDLGADPVELLGRSLYYPAASNGDNPACANGMMAFTSVGTPVTWVCDRLRRLSTEKAALALLHEALHFAGLPEQPHDPNAMTSSEINDMVKDRCGH